MLLKVNRAILIEKGIRGEHLADTCKPITYLLKRVFL